MCQPGSGHRHTGMGRCTCGCCSCGPSFRRFFTAKEEEEWMENYRDQLKKELAGLEERLKERKEK
jgi:glutathione S-transferase